VLLRHTEAEGGADAVIEAPLGVTRGTSRDGGAGDGGPRKLDRQPCLCVCPSREHTQDSIPNESRYARRQYTADSGGVCLREQSELVIEKRYLLLQSGIY
jgi:hypothetical protein